MKLYALSAAILLTYPAASHGLQLPFKLPPKVSELKSAISSYSEQIPSIASLRDRLELPQFLKNLADPIAASPVLSLHRHLVEIPSVTGSEGAVAAWLAEYLTTQNFTVETQAVSGYAGDRMNVFAYLGKNRTTHTLVTSHIDTVPPFIPYKAASSTIYGRGSNDAKGSVASQIIAVEELIRDGVLSEGDISLLYVVGEEFSGDGMKTANHLGVSWQAVIFGEPTENKLAVGHKGILLFSVESVGKASHSGYPHLGINANSHLVQALARLDSLQLPGSDLLGESTLNIGRIEGGVASNVIPASARADIAVRVAGDFDETVAMIKDTVRGIEGVELKFMDVGYGPVELDHDVEGFEHIVCSYGTDVPNLKGEHKKYLYGPGSILTAHGDNEYVLKSDLFDAVNGYKKLIKESLWPTKRVPDIIEGVGLFDQEIPTPAEPEITTTALSKIVDKVESLGIHLPRKEEDEL
ncbi:hypothetical protein BZA05DRAFT_365825 [Tricharina praecox]|uniref:uncharacterized protein n=1 Tax=Tricharina praecox TaxID=43433 RepID=UPI00221F1989|nr:uncharacterized protein BZA05DRAFT_365825 [Tricharina praecox]KAI5858499.1 hypothetical protein BZA05DRAFT_365825 [Tricharina praecox]